MNIAILDCDYYTQRNDNKIKWGQMLLSKVVIAEMYKNAILDSGKQQSLGSMQQMTKKCNMGLEKCWKMENVQFYIQAQKTLGGL